MSFSSLTHGREIADTKSMGLSLRRYFYGTNPEGIETKYLIVVKSSKVPFCKTPELAMYSVMQVLDSEGKELFLELYPSILSAKLAEKIIAKVIKTPKRFISEAE